MHYELLFIEALTRLNSEWRTLTPIYSAAVPRWKRSSCFISHYWLLLAAFRNSFIIYSNFYCFMCLLSTLSDYIIGLDRVDRVVPTPQTESL